MEANFSLTGQQKYITTWRSYGTHRGGSQTADVPVLGPDRLLQNSNRVGMLRFVTAAMTYLYVITNSNSAQNAIKINTTRFM